MSYAVTDKMVTEIPPPVFSVNAIVLNCSVRLFIS